MVVQLTSRDPALALPDGARLLHVGLPKTGTTALQRTAAARRPELLAQGVRYPGRTVHHRKAGYAFVGQVMGWKALPGAQPPGRAEWDRLRDEVHADPARRVWISNENLAEFEVGRLRELVADLGGEVHAVLTMRSLPAILSSAWQEYLKTGLTLTFERWLRAVLADPPGRATPTFRLRNDLSGLVDKWAGLVGPDRLTLVVLDPSDRERVPQAFETLLGLEPGLLSGSELPGDQANRSFTLAEAELVRRVNEHLRGRSDLTWDDHQAYVRRGAIDHLLRREPGVDEPRIVPPAWAVERAVQLAEAHRVRIESTGVRVVGDLAGLAAPVPSVPTALEAHEVPVEACREAVFGVVQADLRGSRRRARGQRPPGAAGLDQVPARVLVRTLADRVVGRARRATGR